MELISSIASEVTQQVGFNITTRDVERVLGSMVTTTNPWEIVDLSDVPVPGVFEILRVMERERLVSFSDDQCVLTDKGREVAQNVHPVVDLSCKQCEGRGISFDRFSDIASKFIEIQRSRPQASHEFDQGYVTPQTTIARFVIAYERGDVFGKDILVLGDDDLVSIMLGLSGLPKSITVVEIDRRLTDFIRDVAAKEGFEIDVEDFDLRKPLPEEHKGRYNTFFTDPPETLKAADAFVGRGVSALKNVGDAGYFGFTRREASLSKWYNVQKLLWDYGVVITDIVHNFSEYINWGYETDTKAWRLSPVKVRPEKNWYRSALYRIQTLEGFKGSTIDYGDENIYEDQESSTT